MKSYVIRATTIVPAAVLGEPEDRTFVTGAEVELPEEYGAHLVAEKLALDASTLAPKPEELGPVDHKKMTLDGLKEEAARRGVQIKASATKKEIAEAINAALEEGGDETATGGEGGAAADSTGREGTPAAVDPEKMSEAELRAEADRRNVPVTSSATKAEIAEAINAAGNAGSDGEQGGGAADSSTGG